MFSLILFSYLKISIISSVILHLFSHRFELSLLAQNPLKSGAISEQIGIEELVEMAVRLLTDLLLFAAELVQTVHSARCKVEIDFWLEESLQLLLLVVPVHVCWADGVLFGL